MFLKLCIHRFIFENRKRNLFFGEVFFVFFFTQSKVQIHECTPPLRQLSAT